MPRATSPTRAVLTALAASILVVAGCAADDPAPTDTPPTDAEPAPDDGEAAPEPEPTGDDDDEAPEDDGDEGDDAPEEVEVTATDVVTGLEAPWDVAFLGDRAFVTERDAGRVLEIGDDGDLAEVRTFDIVPDNEGGLLGLAAGPDGATLYAYYTGPDDNRVVRFDPDDDAEPEVVVEGIPRAGTHNGGRLVFGPDDLLYIGTGDAQDVTLPPDETSLAGKVLRVTADGEVPDDNPFGNEVFSLGHRNVQGLAFDGDGRLFASEFGPDRDDEINLVEAGADHGWPEVTGEAGTEGFADPVLVRQPDEASWTGATVLTGGAIPQWEGDLFVAALRGERLYRVALDDGEVGDVEELYAGERGRLRHVEQAPDGSLWLVTNNTDGRGSPSDGDDRILRLGPG